VGERDGAQNPVVGARCNWEEKGAGREGSEGTYQLCTAKEEVGERPLLQKNSASEETWGKRRISTGQ